MGKKSSNWKRPFLINKQSSADLKMNLIEKLEDCNPKMSSLDHTLLKKFWFKFRKIRKYRRMRHLNSNSNRHNNKPNRKRNPRKINNSNRPHNIRPILPKCKQSA